MAIYYSGLREYSIKFYFLYSFDQDDAVPVHVANVRLSTPPEYKLGDQVATRLAYGTALAKIATNNGRVIALDGDTKNSTYSDKLKKAFPDRYIECFIAEQVYYTCIQLEFSCFI